ncbi:hypothetical protein C482_06022 [Natrialba chahannaoensis JCM 10990]|uniref:PLD phosphodiesterase domain-containing protein n=1 Tax=Natrialba chahannaoensis JCM 10990 TaxID=1227492 RepID=M0AST0_9EURY|nr:phospholipase D family protein [Natrialba chahannaoensis]ELZ01585.1 hypothetical protein C482_06022 [Natrialba chahannaoensis JCM 10990]
MSNIELVNNRWGDRNVEEQVTRLFEDDGTIYLVTGFFTYNAYRAMRPDIVAFLEREPTNELVIVVGAAADQFSATIARDLRDLDENEQVTLYNYPDGFLHAKLYLREGENPAVIVGSANLTQVAFEQNLELSAYVEGESMTDGRIEPFRAWIDDLLAVCDPIRRRDLFKPVMMAKTAVNWFNKGTLLPTRAVLGHRTPYVVGMVILWLVLSNAFA